VVYFSETEGVMADYSSIDNPSTLGFIFYPRRSFTPCPDKAFDLSVPVDPDISISCRFYAGDPGWPWILFFHGNGEVVSDYDDVAPFYFQKGLNLAVADYRGYGTSGGSPTVTHLVQDAHAIFKGTRKELSRRGFGGDLWLMGRSLGSISALELASHYPEHLRGLIIESGFASVIRIIRHLGIPAPGAHLEAIDRACLEMIERVRIPSLIIHGEKDTLVPLEEARDLYAHVGTEEKELLVIPSATHNDIFSVGFKDYMNTLRRFVDKTDKGKQGDPK
jgi:alpha-beta hydrolase superfamily lysophospholipase